MNYLPYIVLVALLSSIAIDCIAMIGGAAAIGHQIRTTSAGGSSSDSELGEAGELAATRGYNQLIQAIKQENLGEILRLLSLAPQLLDYQDPVSRRTPLITAVVSNKPKVVYILTRYANPNQTLKDASGRNAMAWAKQMNYKAVIKLLSNQNTFFPRGFFAKRVKDNPAPENFFGFIHALQEGSLVGASEFFTRDPHRLLNFQDPVSGQTALRVAVLANKPEMVAFLLQQIGIDVLTVQDALKAARALGYSEIEEKIQRKLYSLLHPDPEDG